MTTSTKMEEDLKEKEKKWKITSKKMEDDLKKKMEDDLKHNFKKST